MDYALVAIIGSDRWWSLAFQECIVIGTHKSQHGNKLNNPILMKYNPMHVHIQFLLLTKIYRYLHAAYPILDEKPT